MGPSKKESVSDTLWSWLSSTQSKDNVFPHNHHALTDHIKYLTSHIWRRIPEDIRQGRWLQFYLNDSSKSNNNNSSNVHFNSASILNLYSPQAAYSNISLKSWWSDILLPSFKSTITKDPDPIAALLTYVVLPITLIRLRGRLRHFNTAEHIPPRWIKSQKCLQGKAVWVGDGDNFRMLHLSGYQGWWKKRFKKFVRNNVKENTISVRLAGIDAPEVKYKSIHLVLFTCTKCPKRQQEYHILNYSLACCRFLCIFIVAFEQNGHYRRKDRILREADPALQRRSQKMANKISIKSNCDNTTLLQRSISTSGEGSSYSSYSA